MKISNATRLLRKKYFFKTHRAFFTTESDILTICSRLYFYLLTGLH
jgi:hypothetical protein